tara:strand:- start:1644 stop:1763 length:120 start_codon:yes stop_codon:yes gene_type:complete
MEEQEKAVNPDQWTKRNGTKIGKRFLEKRKTQKGKVKNE